MCPSDMALSAKIQELGDALENGNDLDEFDRSFLESVVERTCNGNHVAALKVGEADRVEAMHRRLCG